MSVETAEVGAVEDRLSRIPAEPGVYLLRDKHRKVIYVGKAKNLRSRVRTYFRGGDERIQVPLPDAAGRRPRDAGHQQREGSADPREQPDQAVQAALQHPSQGRQVVRQRQGHGRGRVAAHPRHAQDLPGQEPLLRSVSLRLGVRETLDTIRKVIPLRTCCDTVFRNRSRPCLEYQIKRCLGPCCLPVDRGEYRRALKNVMLFLEGKSHELVRDLRARMEAAAEELRFEDAARLRDQIRAIEKTAERQQMVSHWGVDQDVFGLYREGGFIEAQVLSSGAASSPAIRPTASTTSSSPTRRCSARCSASSTQGDATCPTRSWYPSISTTPRCARATSASARGSASTILRPQRGDKVRLCEMAAENARQSFVARRNTEDQRSSA